VRDEALLEIAAHRPSTAAELGRTRGMSKGLAEGVIGKGLLAAIKRGAEVPDEDCPEPSERAGQAAGGAPGALVDLLKVLLKHKCDEHHVAQRLIATSADLDRLAADPEPDVPALTGWRRQVFGEDALALKAGRVALGSGGQRVLLVPVENGVALAPAQAAAGNGNRRRRRRRKPKAGESTPAS
jgi:ribonuclease D